MWKLKCVDTDTGWHDFSADQKGVVQSLCVLSFGVGIVFGLFVAFAF